MMMVPERPNRHPSLRELHDRRCFLLGVTEAWKVERLWREELARRAALEATAKRKPGQTRKRGP